MKVEWERTNSMSGEILGATNEFWQAMYDVFVPNGNTVLVPEGITITLSGDDSELLRAMASVLGRCVEADRKYGYNPFWEVGYLIQQNKGIVIELKRVEE